MAVRGSKGSCEALGCEPLMVGGGTGVLLLIDELLEGGLLLGAVLEHEEHAVERRCVGQSALVEFRACQRVRVASESGAAGDFYSLLTTRLGQQTWRRRRWAGEHNQQESEPQQQIPAATP